MTVIVSNLKNMDLQSKLALWAGIQPMADRTTGMWPPARQKMRGLGNTLLIFITKIILSNMVQFLSSSPGPSF